MKKILLTTIYLSFYFFTEAQVPVHMATQPALTYFEDFSDINNWGNSFTSGIGAEHFGPVPIQGTGGIPNPTHTTYTSQFFTVNASSGGLHRDSLNPAMVLLATGTTDNTTAVAVDVFFDFTNINAGTLSFDWASVNNGSSSSNRKGSLRVYGSIDGLTFAEITSAQVLNITNNSPSNGSILNVNLPSNFTNAPDARLRFYYYNGTGGTTGSRPYIRLDNLKVTAQGSACVKPPARPGPLQFGAITATSIAGHFTAASVPPDEYLVIATTNNSLTSLPLDSITYHVGDDIGDGKLIQRSSDTNFLALNLDPVTQYRFFVFPVNIYCSGTIRYNTDTPLTDTQSTIAGPPCVTPGTQAAQLNFNNITPTSISGHFDTALDADEYLVLISTNSNLGAVPQDGSVYQSGQSLGNGTVVYRGAATDFTATNLLPNTTYYFFIYSLNSFICSNGPKYNLINPLTGTQNSGTLLPCQTPDGSGSQLVFSPFENYINGFFNPYPFDGDGYLVVMSASSSLSALPQDQTVYNVGDNLGGGTVISKGKNFSFTAENLNQNTTYHFFIFTYNDICIGDIKYRTGQYLSGQATTSNSLFYNYYFGNLHAHSSYSDGNKDSPNLTPADDYSYAQNAQCMDFLGISEHNHFSNNNNPGMLLAKYNLGLSEAANYTSTHSNFLALYGMEWGVISNGGHALIYGSDSLLGWETLNGQANYDLFVAKSDYLSDSGLFKTVNFLNNLQPTVSMLAHPSSTDFGGLFYKPYNASADSAIVGIAIESGPSGSTDTNYAEPGFSMHYLPYYNWLLSKGYHVAPQIDHDNHNTTFGRTAESRTAVLSTSLMKTDFFEALKNRRFYATQDCDTRANLEIYGKKMGEIFSHTSAPAITVNAIDPSNSSAVPVIKLWSGQPGSHHNPDLLTSDTAYKLNWTDNNLKDSSTAYYYAEITIGGKKTITAPVWYSRLNDYPNAIVEVDPENTFGFELIENPIDEVLRIEIFSQKIQDVQLNFYNAVGQKIKSQTLQLTVGKNPRRIFVGQQAKGLYFVELRAREGRLVKKFLVK